MMIQNEYPMSNNLFGRDAKVFLVLRKLTIANKTIKITTDSQAITAKYKLASHELLPFFRIFPVLSLKMLSFQAPININYSYNTNCIKS